MISQFGGIAPIFEGHKPGIATTAQNVDLSSGKPRPLKDNTAIQSVANASTYNSIIKYGGTWYYGSNKFYLDWVIGANDVLFWLDSGVMKKMVGGVTVNVGQAVPSVPTISLITTGVNIRDYATTGTYTWKRSALNGDQYCVLESTGGNPGLALPTSVSINGVIAKQGSLSDGLLDLQWDYGDNDNLGYSTIYVHVAGYLTSDTTIFAYTSTAGNVSGTVYYVICSERTVGSTLGTEICSNPADLSQAKWTLAGDFAVSGTYGTFTKSSGAGTITQTKANQALAATAYLFHQIQYTISAAPTVAGATMTLTTAFASTAINLPLTAGAHTIYFWAAASPGNIVLSVSGATSGSFTIQGISIKQIVGGMIDKSGPSAVTAALSPVENSIVRVTAPTFTDALTTSWYIYRISDATAQYELVAQVPVSAPYYDDNIADSDLGVAMDTEYTGASSGETITYAPPPASFDGIANAIYSAMIFAWKGSTLYWCEPGKPDAWPSVYSINFMFPIQNVIVGMIGAVVLCEDGPYPINGSDSETMYASIPLGTEACIDTHACSTAKGVVYATDSGLILTTLAGTQSITDAAFGMTWWKANISGYTMMAEIDKRLIISYSGGTLILDASMMPQQLTWGNLSATFYAAWKNPTDGLLYVLDSVGIKEFMGASTYLSLEWKSGKLYGDSPTEKTFDIAMLRGTGSITLVLAVDGTTVATKTINMDSTQDRDKQLKFPEQSNGKYCTVDLSGSGSVDDVVIGILES